MTKEERAKRVYMKITSHANYAEMNGISREWIISKIAESLDDNQELSILTEKYNLLKEQYESDIIDMTFYYKDLLNEYATVCSSEGLGNYNSITEGRMNKIKDYPLYLKEHQ